MKSKKKQAKNKKPEEDKTLKHKTENQNIIL